MDEVLETEISCPYCGENIDVVVEMLDESQEYIEDCQVCCRPIVFRIQVDIEATSFLSVHSENETF